MNYDAYSSTPRPVSEATLDTRATFIVRTYAHLMVGILTFAALITVLLRSGVGVKLINAISGAPGGPLLFLGGFVVAGWLGSRMAARAVSLPAQYFGYAVIIAAYAVMFTPLLYIASTYYEGVIFQAAVATLVGFSGLTAIAFVTRKDFSFLGGIVKWGMFCALGLIVASMVWGFDLGILFSVVMVALSGASILHDTSDILHRYPENRYVAASLALFCSVALMFFYLVDIFMRLQD